MLDGVQPTLFIALGGTGAEVLWRIRRRILNTLWNTYRDQPVQLNSLTEFPFAQFLRIDLDPGSGEAARTDLLSSKIRFKEEEKIVKKLDLLKYISTDDDLKKYPLIAEWFPLKRSELKFHVDFVHAPMSNRAISRLYFFDQYENIKSKIKDKIDRLLSNVTSADAAKRLGLKMQSESLKVVVVASTAGGTGSGGFLDLGYLVRILGQKTVAENSTTNLVLMLPTGYSGANITKTQANTYGALMELETCMREGLGYIKRWNNHDIIRDMPNKPYDDIYLIDTANLADAQTEEVEDVFEMLADALFEDFSTADFACSRSIYHLSAVKQWHKTEPYDSLVDQKKYGDMRLSFSRDYSSFGQATIDTHLEQKKNGVLYRHVNSMLQAFFGVSVEDNKSNHPTEGERDELLAKYMYLGVSNEMLDYDFVAPSERFYKGMEYVTYPLIRELLRINGVVQLDAIEQQVAKTFEAISDSGNYKEWPGKVARAVDQITHDAFRTVESNSGLHVDAVEKRRAELLHELLDAAREEELIKTIWARVDNKAQGGLDYAIELLRYTSNQLKNTDTGLIKALEENARWFADLSGHLSNQESAVLQEHLRQAIGKFIGAQTRSRTKLEQIARTIQLSARYHLYATACSEAAKLLREFSNELDKRSGTDKVGNPLWAGFMGELEAGRSTVCSLIEVYCQ